MSGNFHQVLIVELETNRAHPANSLGSWRRANSARCHSAASLQEALAYLQARKPADLILLSSILPDSSGLEALAKLRARAPEVAVVVLGHDETGEEAKEYILQGAQDYLAASEYDEEFLPCRLDWARERNRREHDLREYGRRIRRLVDATTDYIYSVKLREGRPVETVHSPNCVKLTGYEMAEFESDTQLWFRMIYEADRVLVLAQLGKVLNGERVPPLEHRILHKQAGVRWIRNTFVPHYDEQERLVSYDGLITDITESKLAALQLAQAEKRYHDLVNHLNVGVYRNTSGEQGHFLEANPALVTMLGADSKEELLRQKVRDFYVDPARRKEFSDKIRAQGYVQDEELELKTLRGNRFWASVSAIMIKQETDQIFFDGVIQDITDRKKAQLALKQAHEKLQASHQELRTTQLQLIQAAKMESIGTLAAGVAHEVKNPLQTLLMGLAYLDRNLAPTQEELRETVQDMHAAVKRADLIIRELLQLSAASQVAMQWGNLNELIERSLWLLHYEIAAGQFKIVKNLLVDLPRVHVDSNKMEQVFVNLFLNALQAMPQGGCLTLNTRRQTWTSIHKPERQHEDQIRPGDLVVIVEIQDTGPGISEANLARIFDPFFTTKQVGEGTGLGLSIVKKIMDMHGGIILVENAAGGGVQVTLVLKAETGEKL